MQFHLNGFTPGDPEVCHGKAPAPLPQRVDVLIVGAGPTGLTLAAQLAAFPGITTCVVEQKHGPLLVGQADGIACRTMEMFQAFGFAERVAREACWVNETAFWRPDPAAPAHIARARVIQDVEDGLSEFPHVVLNQARVHDFYLDLMRHAATPVAPAYSRRLLDLVRDDGAGDHPLTARFEASDPRLPQGLEAVRARYVVGCDGARSAVRQALGRALVGDSANQAWGVMDVLAVTDFPDVRRKAVIQSASQGSMLIIPREGGYMVRLYIELDALAPDQRVAALQVTPDHLVAAARRILAPYSLDVKQVAWWSVYEIGQRLCARFDDRTDDDDAREPRIFIAGDACHTHSPKAGQGMNVSMQDAFNLGWKLAAVLMRRSPPSLLATYSAERRAVAGELLDFDRRFAALFSARPAGASGAGEVPAAFEDYFVQQGRFTAGTATRYPPALLVGPGTHQHLATGFTVGMRFHSAPVVRLADARPLQLGHVVRADGRWRLFSFAARGERGEPGSQLGELLAFLADAAASPLRRNTPAGADIDAVIEVLAVFQQPHRELTVTDLPGLLLPRKGRFGLVDYEKAYCPAIEAAADIFDLRGVDREQGCMVVVRPDQYVAHVLPLNGHAELAAFFARCLRPAA
ncbi:MAG: FAD-dependent monooxygenase [Gammaproteobacteria bacterium]|nr:FAD-dependent monooxygenase [Gammaproteobacteria bacterium]